MPSPPTFSADRFGAKASAHAMYVGDRINTSGFEEQALSSVPLAVRAGAGIAVLFRYGVIK